MNIILPLLCENMLISFVFLLLLFVMSLLTTFFINFPTNNKFTAWIHGFFTLHIYKSDAQKKVITSSTATTEASSTTGAGGGGSYKNNNNAEYRAELKSVFATFDKNNDGFITRQELQESLNNIGIAITDKDVKEMMENVDSNGDGLIDIDEFRDLFESIMSPSTSTTVDGTNGKEEKEEDGGAYLKEAFNVFDEDGDGVITVEELGMVLSSLGFKQGKVLESCKEMIRKVDGDGDGNINFDEFKTMMKAGTPIFPVS